MCFSAPASFVASAVLVTTGSYCVKKAAERDRDYLAFAAVPILFGVQQFFEGFVWIGLNAGIPWMVKLASYAFLFFAFGFWPFYAPLSVFLAEKREVNPEIKDLLWVLTVIGLVVGTALGIRVIGPRKIQLRVTDGRNRDIGRRIDHIEFGLAALDVVNGVLADGANRRVILQRCQRIRRKDGRETDQ